ncbi:MAG: FHA domain-containing protein [Lachnospiraceae bacterium]|nr:FHA domain-containing protein [Lachnospiraceae bacterium]
MAKNFTFKKSEIGTTMTGEFGEDVKIDEALVEVLHGDHNPSIPEIAVEKKDDKVVITSSASLTITLADIMKDTVNRPQVLLLFRSLSNVLLSAQQGCPTKKLMLGYDEILVDPKTLAVNIFMDPTSDAEGELSVAEVQDFLRNVLSHLFFFDGDGDNYVMKMLNAINYSGFDLAKTVGLFEFMVGQQLGNVPPQAYAAVLAPQVEKPEGPSAEVPATPEVTPEAPAETVAPEEQPAGPQAPEGPVAPQDAAPEVKAEEVVPPDATTAPQGPTGPVPFVPQPVEEKKDEPVVTPQVAEAKDEQPTVVPQPVVEENVPQAPVPQAVEAEVPAGPQGPVVEEPKAEEPAGPQGPVVEEPKAEVPAGPQGPVVNGPVVAEAQAPVVEEAKVEEAPAPEAPKPKEKKEPEQPEFDPNALFDPIPGEIKQEKPAQPFAPQGPAFGQPANPVQPQGFAPQQPVNNFVPQQPQAPMNNFVPQAPVQETPVAPAEPVVPVEPVAPQPSAPQQVAPMANGPQTPVQAVAPQAPNLAPQGNINMKIQGYLLRQRTGEKIEMGKPMFKIGKSHLHADYAIEGNPAISRVHALIQQVSGKYVIKDNSSTNGTFVDGVRVLPGEEKELAQGSEIRLGDEKFTFEIVTR